MLLLDVTQEFDRQLKAYLGHKPNAYQFLKTHERRTLVLTNLCAQVLAYENAAGPRATKAQRNLLIKEGVKIFCSAALQHKHQQLMSDIQRHMVANPPEQRAKEEMKEIFKEKSDE